jgi:hypothetical protein
MTDDRKKTLKEESRDRLQKAKGRLQQSFPEIRQIVRASSAVEDVARKIIDPAQSLFRQFADDIQLKDLLAKAESLVANANLAFSKPVSRDPPPAETLRDEAPSNESSKTAGIKKTPSKRPRLKKAAPKKTPSKKKKKRAPKRRVKARSSSFTGGR